MAFDYKKEFKDLYAPTTSPAILTVPPMRFVAVRGSGDPNAEEGQYAQATQLLYGISYTIKMSKKSKNPADHIVGYHDYVVPPLEGLWWMYDGTGYTVDFSRKDRFEWVSMIRLPEFVTDDVFARAKATFAAKHPEVDTELAYLFDFDEGDVAQVLHKGPYYDEPATVAALDAFIDAQGHRLDFTEDRHHHEIYLSDPRRSKPENLRTIIRHPVKRAANL
ncbi:MAG: GyrI-like domain-containing protein [Ancrocorticia sp.]